MSDEKKCYNGSKFTPCKKGKIMALKKFGKFAKETPGREEETSAPEQSASFAPKSLTPAVEEAYLGVEETRSKKKKKKKAEEPVRETVRFFPDANRGLTQEQVARHTEAGNVNLAPKRYSKTYGRIFSDNILTFFNLLCVLCAIALSIANAELSQFLFVPIFVGNIAIGLFQEIRSKIKIDKLTILTAPHTQVVRDGVQTEIPTHQIVLDDIVVLEIGQQVPADCLVVSGMAEVNESLLTGESVAVKKVAGDTVYAGSFLTSGSCHVRVEKIANETYVSKLTSKAKQYKKPKSEIMNSVKMFIRVIAFLLVPIGAGMFWRNWSALCSDFLAALPKEIEMSRWQIFHFGFNPESDEILQEFSTLIGEGALFADAEALSHACRLVFNEAIQRTASVVIGMIPSGLLLLTSLALAVGVFRLAQNNTLVQDLYSLEMLARVNVLCLDKTGTITDGQMSVSEVKELSALTDYSVNQIMGSMLSVLPDNNQTSIALNNHFGHCADLPAKTFIPFSSARKFSAVTFKNEGTYALGAPEFILKPVPIQVERAVKRYAQKGMRVILLGHSAGEITNDEPPKDFKPVALISLQDNIRKDAVETISWFKENDVEIKIISGDNPITVSEIAKRTGIKGADKYISLEGLSPLEVQNAAVDYTVFGRVTPEQKAILIRQFKACGDTVAMTGDGVNDILAMKEADCAISIASGSEAARNVSNIVLLDNDFASMPNVVYEGRRVINNVKNSASLYLMKTFFTAILAIFCLLTGASYFFKTSNLILFELFIAGIPSLFLSQQPNTERVHGKFITHVISRALPGACTMALAVLALYITSTPLFAKVFTALNGTLGELVVSGETESYTLSQLILKRFQEDYLALAFVALTFSGTVMLYRLCQPFNLMRGTLWATSFLICVVCILTIPDFFFSDWSATSVNFSFTEVLYLVLILVLCFPLSNGLIKFFEKLNNSSGDD